MRLINVESPRLFWEPNRNASVPRLRRDGKADCRKQRATKSDGAKQV